MKELNEIKNIKRNKVVDKDRFFSDNPLRMLNQIVFSIKYNCEIENETLEVIIRNSEKLNRISYKKKNKELKKIFNVQNGVYRLVLFLNKTDMLKHIFPHINNQKEVYQWFKTSKNEFKPDIRGIHLEGKTVFDHTLEVLKNTKPGWVNGWCSLFHDIGKTNFTRLQLLNKTVGFPGHDEAGSKYVKTILNKFYNLDKETIEIVSLICKYHMKIYNLMDCGNKEKKKFVEEIPNKYHRQYLYDLCIADTKGTLKTQNAIYSQIDRRFINQIESYGEFIDIRNKSINL